MSRLIYKVILCSLIFSLTITCHRQDTDNLVLIRSISPNQGVELGGTAITITGDNFFDSAAVVKIGGVDATSVVVVNTTTITAVTPAGTVGTQDVRLEILNHSWVKPNGFTYTGAPPTVSMISPSTGSDNGGTSVTITGSHLADTISVTIGGNAATSVSVVNDTTITAVTPAGTAGAQDVAVTTPSGTGTLDDGFTYVDITPAPASIAPTNGPQIGGTPVMITGTNFTSGATVTIGGVAATDVNVVNSTTITAVTGAASSGASDVVITYSGEPGTLSNGYTYNTSYIYTTIWNTNHVSVFGLNDNGDVAPGQAIAGGATTLNNPVGIFVTDDEIFIANFNANSILVFNKSASGNSPPIRTITGGSSGINRPTGIFVDTVADEIYVSNHNANSITVHNLSDNGNIAPKRSIIGGNTGLNSPEGLFVYNDEIFICQAQAIEVFDTSDSGNVTPNRTITGGATGLNFPQAVCVAADQIFIANLLSSNVLIFNVSDNGNIAPTRSIGGGSTQIGFIQAVFVTPTEIFTASDGINNVAVFDINDSGNVAPKRVIAGGSTGFNEPEGVFVR